MAVKGNDYQALRAQWDAKQQQRDEAEGGFRIRLGEQALEVRPGQLTFHHRREVKRRIGITLDEIGSELASGTASIDTLAAIVWVAAYQADPSDPPDIDGILEWLSDDIDPAEDIDVELFGADDGEADLVDPTNSEPT